MVDMYAVGMANGQIEILVEPFKENDPGPHVKAAIDALQDADLKADMGAFATTASGDLESIIKMLPGLLTAGFDSGATSIQLRLTIDDA